MFFKINHYTAFSMIQTVPDNIRLTLNEYKNGIKEAMGH